MTEEQLSALLRLKRFEQPPPQYFDRLLQDIHRRQRAELLRRPLWKIAAERMQTFFSEHSMGHLSYAGALASVMIVGVGAIGLMTSGGGNNVARTEFPKPIEHGSAEARSLTLRIDSAKSQPALGVPSLPAVGGRRYIIDAQPASYEVSSAYRF